MSNIGNDILVEQVFEKFVRTYPYEFSMETACDFFYENGCNFEPKSLFDFVSAHPMVFKITNGMYISRAGFFTNKKFSIKPLVFEVASGIVIPGHRTLPFTDPNQIPDELEFFVNGEVVPKKIVTVPLSKVVLLYRLFGQEYISSIISYDSANSEKGFAKNGFGLPQNISITVLNFQKWYRKWNFSENDRLILEVTDWNLGFIDVAVQKDERTNPFEITVLEAQREKWYGRYEKCLLASIMRYGSCKSIEEQLAYTYFIANEKVMVSACGSSEEFLDRTKSFEIKSYGIETRLSSTKVDIPVISDWLELFDNAKATGNTLYSDLGLAIPNYILEASILDSLYQRENTFLSIPARIVPEKWYFNKKTERLFLLLVVKEYQNIAPTYNFFTDYQVGGIRQEALNISFKLLSLFCDLKMSHIPITSFPNQPLIIFKQLLRHVNQLIEVLVYQRNMDDKELEVASLSLDGMRYRYGQISSELQNAIKVHQYDCFKLI